MITNNSGEIISNFDPLSQGGQTMKKSSRSSRKIKVPERYSVFINEDKDEIKEEIIETDDDIMKQCEVITSTINVENPWHNVSNFESFLFYGCPECVYKNTSVTEFANHISANHIKVNY